MASLHVSFDDSEDHLELPLVQEDQAGLWGLEATLTAPSSEAIRVNVAFFEGNRGVTVNVWTDGPYQFLQVGGFCAREQAFSPAIYFRTPRGQHVSLLLEMPSAQG
jgi:hypothetical protein